MEIAGVDSFVGMIEWDTARLLTRLALVSGTIASLVELRAEARSEELRSKAQAWGATGETAGRAKELASNFAALPASTTRWETEAQLEALREEKDFIVFLVGVKQNERELVHG